MNLNDDYIVISPVSRIRGELRLLGDKSISHRAAMIAALANGRSVLENFSSADDCAATLHCLQALAVNVTKDGSSVVIDGGGLSGLRQPVEALDAQNSGTAMRLLAGILSGLPFETTITGDASLLTRPMGRIAEPLRLMGARVELETNGCAPLKITGRRPLQAIDYKSPIASAQIKSAILLAGLFAEGITTVEEPEPTRDHTEIMLSEFGASVSHSGNVVSVQGGAKLTAREIVIPGDISSAAFLIAPAAALSGSELRLRGVGLNPTRTGFVDTLVRMGVDIKVTEEQRQGGEAVGSIRVRGQKMTGPPKLEISGALVSGLIDELPLLAFFAASVGCEMTLRDAGELRFKESDRIAATVQNLTRMGACIEEREDGWSLQRGPQLRGVQLSSFGDHRIAMACATAALAADGPSQIEGAHNVVAVSLPEFWTLLESVAE